MNPSFPPRQINGHLSVFFVLFVLACRPMASEDRRAMPTKQQEDALPPSTASASLSHSKLHLKQVQDSLNSSGLTTLQPEWKTHVGDKTFQAINDHLSESNGAFPDLFHAQGRLKSDCDGESTSTDLNWGISEAELNSSLINIVPSLIIGLPLPEYGPVSAVKDIRFDESRIYKEEEISCEQADCLLSQLANIDCGNYQPLNNNSNTAYIKALRICGLQPPPELSQFEHFIGAEKAISSPSPEQICQ